MTYTPKRAPTLLLSVLLIVAAAWPERAWAEQEHRVGKGQTLSSIAGRYGVSVAALAAANRMKREDSLREGQLLVVPARGELYVTEGDTLASIARRHDVQISDLARTNGLAVESQIRIGQRLLLPGFEAAEKQQAAEQRWGRTKRPGTAALYREATQERRTLKLLDRRGRVPDVTLKTLSRFLRPRGQLKGKGKSPHPRVIKLLSQVSDHFGGREIHVISGYRKPGGYTKDTSRHVAGQAIDFRIPGVPLEVLRDYCGKLRHVGVGYYPNSHFVHLDVRQTDARWTDRSGPGQAPQFVRPGEEEDVADEPAAPDDGKPPIDDDPAPGVDTLSGASRR
jgi:uncharacterized protein YcbK (DUF882 family)